MDHEKIGIIPAQGNHTEEGWLFGQMLTLDQICRKSNELVLNILYMHGREKKIIYKNHQHKANGYPVNNDG